MILKFKILIIGGFLFFILKFYYVGFIKIFSINFMYCMGWIRFLSLYVYVVVINLIYLVVFFV